MQENRYPAGKDISYPFKNYFHSYYIGFKEPLANLKLSQLTELCYVLNQNSTWRN